MKKFFLLSLCYLCITNLLNAQNWVWSQRLGNAKSDKVTCVKTDGLGNVFIAGYFSTSITLGTNNLPLSYTANTQSKEIFLAKLDSTGVCLWAKSGGQYFDDRVLGMDVDSAGYSIITGTFWEGSGINIGPLNITGSAYGYGDQCFIAKHDPNGNALWGTFVCSNSGDDQGLDIATDKAGNHYVVGFMTGTTLYCGGNTITATNPNTGSHKHCYFMAKMNSAGTFQWARTFGSLPWDPSHNKYIERDIAVCVDDSGGVYATGGFDLTRSFGTNSFTSVGGYDIFVIKYDTLGAFQWATPGGSDKDDWSNGICSDKKGNIYITGEHRDSLIMDTILVKNYDKRDVFVIKLDAKTGKPFWGKRAGSDLGSERGNDIWADSMCNVYVCGDINDSAKFGDNIIIPPGNSVQAFVARISPDGKWQWVATGGGVDSNDRCNAIAKGKGAQIYAAGFFRSPATFGTTPTLSSVGSSDGFFARLHDSSLNKGGSFELKLPSDTVLCLGENVILDIPDHAYLEFSPQAGAFPNADTSAITFSPQYTTTYKLTGFSKGSCPVYDTLSFTIEIAPDPVAEFTINPEVALLANPNFDLTNMSTGADSYEWYYTGNLISTATDIQQTFDSAGQYCFKLIAITNAGCKDSVEHCGKIVKEERLFFPNAFSPNGDGTNDEFRPFIFNVEFSEISQYSLIIANRFGEIVYESNDPQQGWDGTQRGSGKRCDVGTYYYICKLHLPRKPLQEFKGDINLIR
ncbi:MAG: gliding motility-associated C-terminal domain-containing protein [Chitinophagaceae bacterium]|nr:gliding motility-associated C-terminal domain-containing protein [Chitinophagaceae bacterium]